MPSSRQVRRIRSAISPRLAMSTVPNVMPLFLRARFDGEQWLAVLHRFPIGDQNVRNAAVLVRLDRCHELHGLENAHLLPGLDQAPGDDERLGARLARAVERAYHLGPDVPAGGLLRESLG